MAQRHAEEVERELQHVDDTNEHAAERAPGADAASPEHTAEAAGRDWSEEEIRVLKRGMATFPEVGQPRHLRCPPCSRARLLQPSFITDPLAPRSRALQDPLTRAALRILRNLGLSWPHGQSQGVCCSRPPFISKAVELGCDKSKIFPLCVVVLLALLKSPGVQLSLPPLAKSWMSLLRRCRQGNSSSFDIL